MVVETGQQFLDGVLIRKPGGSSEPGKAATPDWPRQASTTGGAGWSSGSETRVTGLSEGNTANQRSLDGAADYLA